MGVDHHDPRAAVTRQQRRLKSLENSSPLRNSPGTDSSHAGAGHKSIALGDLASAAGAYGVVIGSGSHADGESATAVGADSWADGAFSSSFGEQSEAFGDYGTALGWRARAPYADSTAVGRAALTTAPNQVRLGTSIDDVSVPGDLTVNGTFSNPSARHLKRNIVPAPSPRDVFPDLVEFEYIDGDGRRHLGYIAGDLVGTGAERFITKWDDEGRAVAIDRIGLLTAQVTALRAELDDIRDAIGGGNGRDL